MKRNTPWVLVAFLLGLLVGQPALSNASTAQSTGFTFCVNKSSGALRQLLKGSCNSRTESVLVMGAQGPAGARGPAGPAGPAGAAGSIGPQGLPGVGIEFQLIDGSGTPIDRVVELNLSGTDTYTFHNGGSGDLSFTRLIDGWLWRYTFDGSPPTSPWASQIEIYFLNNDCTGNTYSSVIVANIPPVSTALQRLYYNWANYETGGKTEYYRLNSTQPVFVDEPVDVWRLEGGSFVSDGQGNQWWEPPSCSYAGKNTNLLQVSRYTIPGDVTVQAPVTIRWLD